MLRKIIFGFAVTICLSSLAQNDKTIYANMALHDAIELQKDFPNEVEILSKKGNEAAVYMSTYASHKLHDRVLVHGPGYIYKANEEQAIQSLYAIPSVNRTTGLFTIDQDAIVAQAIDVIDVNAIETHILELEGYGTRHHATASGTQASIDLKAKWEAMATQYNRSDVSVRLFDHTNTSMPSVIMTIEGTELPDEFVIIGGHLDSTSSQSQTNAPGADDDASGIATITEATRALFEIGFVPKRTIEVMAYAAEEIGLVGSAEIAQQYVNENRNVAAVAQFDMTLYNGSSNDISFITDFTNATLNDYMMELLDHYNASGTHAISYSTSICNYGCSDHASWTAAGYMSTFPFEANFGDHNFNIHTPQDNFSVAGDASHSVKFAKLGAEFLIEVAKANEVLGIDEATANAVNVSYGNGFLSYTLEGNTQKFIQVVLYDALGKQITSNKITQNRGTLSISNLQTGLYIASFITEGRGAVSKKILVK